MKKLILYIILLVLILPASAQAQSAPTITIVDSNGSTLTFTVSNTYALEVKTYWSDGSSVSEGLNGWFPIGDFCTGNSCTIPLAGNQYVQITPWSHQLIGQAYIVPGTTNVILDHGRLILETFFPPYVTWIQVAYKGPNSWPRQWIRIASDHVECEQLCLVYTDFIIHTNETPVWYRLYDGNVRPWQRAAFATSTWSNGH